MYLPQPDTCIYLTLYLPQPVSTSPCILPHPVATSPTSERQLADTPQAEQGYSQEEEGHADQAPPRRARLGAAWMWRRMWRRPCNRRPRNRRPRTRRPRNRPCNKRPCNRLPQRSSCNRLQQAAREEALQQARRGPNQARASRARRARALRERGNPHVKHAPYVSAVTLT